MKINSRIFKVGGVSCSGKVVIVCSKEREYGDKEYKGGFQIFEEDFSKLKEESDSDSEDDEKESNPSETDKKRSKIRYFEIKSSFVALEKYEDDIKLQFIDKQDEQYTIIFDNKLFTPTYIKQKEYHWPEDFNQYIDKECKAYDPDDINVIVYMS